MTNNHVYKKLNFTLTIAMSVAAFFAGFYGNVKLCCSTIKKETTFEAKRELKRAPLNYHHIAAEQVSNASIMRYFK